MMVVERLTAGYGGLLALRDVSLTVEAGEWVAIIGANGAGKSTLLRAIQGVISPRSGSVRLDQEEISRCPTSQIVEKGLVLVPEDRGLFRTMTVKDNLSLGAYHYRGQADFMERSTRRLKDVYRLFPLLQERSNQLAETLSGGQQQMLAIGRALMSDPKILMLDEPSLGVAPKIIMGIFEAVSGLCREGIGVLMVEQNARSVLQKADRAYVLERGSVTKSGRASTLLQDPGVVAAYLGKSLNQAEA